MNCLEMMAVFNISKYVLPDLKDHHVLVLNDNTSVIFHIKRQEVLYSCLLQTGTPDSLVVPGENALLESNILPRGARNLEQTSCRDRG